MTERERARTRGRTWLAGVVTVAVTMGLFLSLEGLLAVAGVAPASPPDDPFVRLDPSQPLFEPGGSGSPMMVTAEEKLRFFNYQSFPRVKGTDTCRIFCLGGSTTFGRPYDDGTSFAGWLREMLPAAEPARRWEVINAGGISYASYRVVRLMEELANYEPDVFIVYTGHNEFLEARRYGPSGRAPWLDDLRRVLRHTRVYTLARQCAGPFTGKDSDAVGAALPSEVVTRLEHAIGPEDYTRDPALARATLDHFRYNLERMVALADSAGATIIFVTPASNIRDCSPFKSEHREGMTDDERASWTARYAEAQAAMGVENWGAAEAALTEALALDNQFAESWFMGGQTRDALGNFDGAREAFIRARDLDVCPLRAPSSFVEAVRTVASAEEVPCVDLVARLEERASQGIPGREFFVDHVHPTVEGQGVLAQAILEELDGPLGISIPSNWETEAMPDIARSVSGRVDEAARVLALRNIAQVYTWAGKFAEALPLARVVAAATPDDAEAHFLLAWDAQVLGDYALAEEEYRMAAKLKPDHRLAILKLAEVLAAQGHREAALTLYRKAVEQRPADPERRVALADFLAAGGAVAEARSEYEAVLVRVPVHAGALRGLAKLVEEEVVKEK